MNDGQRVSQEMYDWYTRYYTRAPHSAAHHDFCERVYGKDLCQHGYMDMAQLHALLNVLQLSESDHVLELGCGCGLVADYISDATGARVHGVDYIPTAIEQANDRTREKRGRLTFTVGDINTLDFPPATFSAVIAIDTLYFSDLNDTIGRLKLMLKPGGQIGAYYTLMLWNEDDDTTTLQPDRTPLATALTRHGLTFQTWDYTRAEYDRSRLIQKIAPEFQPRFAAEDNLFLFENRMIEANGNAGFYEAGRLCRYLYQVR